MDEVPVERIFHQLLPSPSLKFIFPFAPKLDTKRLSSSSIRVMEPPRKKAASALFTRMRRSQLVLPIVEKSRIDEFHGHFLSEGYDESFLLAPIVCDMNFDNNVTLLDTFINQLQRHPYVDVLFLGDAELFRFFLQHRRVLGDRLWYAPDAQEITRSLSHDELKSAVPWGLYTVAYLGKDHETPHRRREVRRLDSMGYPVLESALIHDCITVVEELLFNSSSNHLTGRMDWGDDGYRAGGDYMRMFLLPETSPRFLIPQFSPWMVDGVAEVSDYGDDEETSDGASNQDMEEYRNYDEADYFEYLDALLERQDQADTPTYNYPPYIKWISQSLTGNAGCVGASIACSFCALLREATGGGSVACYGSCSMGIFGNCIGMLGLYFTRVYADNSVICTELFSQGYLDLDTYVTDASFGVTLNQDVVEGYHILAKPAVSVMKWSPTFTKVVR
ncbi:unnamed protein product [Cyprideis torosa]|uniref:Uncharacterized protein n=1 Tax=Cyprideis torosa TaxID=163714 RepID=A0A7R8W527_9CRUS|nr:unnamed protein product [Cyprideis torosa]CAG0880170.1 unnamed protein product [Cyprideis torosa]